MGASNVVFTMLVDVQRSGMPVQVDDLDDRFVLELVRDAEEQDRAAELRKLRLAQHWAERHAVDDVLAAAHWSDADLRDIEQTIGGEGTPLVAAGCVEPLAVALGVSPRTAMQLMSDALDLQHRLPQTRSGLHARRIAPWRARQVARLTSGLSKEAAAYVDAKLAPVADACGAGRIRRLVDEAAALFDPDQQAVVEDEAEAVWGVRLEAYAGPVWGGTSILEIIGDTPTLTRFHDLVCAEAHDQLDPPVTIGTVEKLGPLTVARIREWLGSARFTLQPLLDLRREDAVDHHDPPAWMRELVILRDQRCVHPFCNRLARECDLDHIEAYAEMDDGGPPGQTRPDNLAPLCRRHHRAKTHFAWTYHRNADGTYTWTSPHGARFTVDIRGIVTAH